MDQGLFLVVRDVDEHHPAGAEAFSSSTRSAQGPPPSRSPSGSSRSRAFGLVTSTRASATRCCWPPERALGFPTGQLGEPDPGGHPSREFAPLILRHLSACSEQRTRCRARCGVERERNGGTRSSSAPCAEAGRRARPARRGRCRRRSGTRARRSSAASCILPQPDGPSRTTYSPWSTCRLTSSTATTPPANSFVRLIRSRPDPLRTQRAARGHPRSSPAASSDIPALRRGGSGSSA